eukprot:CAMPEP_0114569548 /NCGR_PEP_ID=MMETSP0114-20121206/16692_1 /TAXON_ID=31324 /ORGANISM="Goniomonas sp, Strain m" /LENGTH=64 /DNA_ID=CAMNT_0001756449 /DNA_START=100 /DNA_END=291 /DNA_ORIENTATION=+
MIVLQPQLEHGCVALREGLTLALRNLQGCTRLGERLEQVHVCLAICVAGSKLQRASEASDSAWV